MPSSTRRRGARRRDRPAVPAHGTGADRGFRLLGLGAADRPDRAGRGAADPERGEPGRSGAIICDVRDVVRAYRAAHGQGRAAARCTTSPRARRRRSREILRTLLSFTERKIEVRVDPDRLRKSDIPYLAGSYRKIKARTGWMPRIPLETTLRDVLEYWRG